MHTSVGKISNPRLVEIFYWFKSNDIQVCKEYLIYDENGLIGSVGGTLGLFIGFSFNYIIQELFLFLEKHLICLCSK